MSFQKELDDIIFEPNIIILSVFGYLNKVSEPEFQEKVIMQLLQQLERIPDKILLPSEGTSSIYLQEWAEALHITTQVFHSDWKRNGKIAQIIRDDRMQKECTHALVFLTDKTEKLRKNADKMVKKEKKVFTYHTQLQLLNEPVVHASQASKPVRKSNKETGQTLLKFQKKEVH